MEEHLHQEFRELRRRGIKVKAWWLKTRAKQILQSTNPSSSFKLSDGWFTGFKKRYRISLRRPTTPPTNTNFRLTFLLIRLQEALYEDLAV